jgi:hypothetical protein
MINNPFPWYYEDPAGLRGRLAPLIIAVLSGGILAANHVFFLHQGKTILVIVLLAPMFLLLGVGGLVDPRLLWSIGPAGRELPLGIKLIGVGIAVAGLLVSAFLMFAVYNFPNVEPIT